MDEALRPTLDRFQRIALIVGAAALLICLLGALLVGIQQFLQSYLYAYFFWFGIALGSVAILLIHHLAWGKWGYVTRRIFEAAAMVLPLMALLFLPVLFGMQALYTWSRPEVVAADALIQAKQAYLNIPFFVIRAIVYFAAWLVLAYFLYRWSLDQDRTGDPAASRRLRTIAGPGIVLYVLTMTFAAFDWAMSLDPHWFSGIFGVIFMAGQALSAMAFATACVILLSKYKPLSEVLETQQISDLGNFLFAFTLFWAYVNVSQLIIIWAGNMGEDNIWYLVRLQTGWRWLGLFLVIFHFAIPFFVLLSRRIKRNARVLIFIAIAILVLRLFDLFWLIVPSYQRVGIQLYWLDLVMVVAIGGLWLAAFIWQLKSKPLLPLNDPKMRAAVAHHD